MALPDLPVSGLESFETTLRSVLHGWRDAIGEKSALVHSHVSTYLTISATSALLGTVDTDAELGSTTTDHKFWMGNSGTSTWTEVGSMNILEAQIFV